MYFKHCILYSSLKLELTLVRQNNLKISVNNHQKVKMLKFCLKLTNDRYYKKTERKKKII